MEKALRYELNKIPEIKDRIFPTNAPAGKKPPYLVYIIKKGYIKNLNGTTNDRECNVMLNIFGNSYLEMKDLTKKVEDLVITLPLRIIGEGNLYIEDLTLDDTTETYEDELKYYRGIIPFKICYKEE